MSNSSLSSINYLKPQSHSQTQTKWVLDNNQKIFAASLKVIDLKFNPAQSKCFFPALTGAYASIKTVQLKLNGILVDFWNSTSVIPYLLAMSGNNEKQIGINAILYATGNNVKFDNETQLLSFNRPLVDANSAQVKLNVYSDLLNHIGIINDSLEIIIDWNTNPADLFCPQDPLVPVINYNIEAPYLSFETMKQDFKQPEKIIYRQWVEDQWVIPAIVGDKTAQTYELRSNAFMNKKLNRLLLTNTPTGYNTNADCAKLYNLFNRYMSVPMAGEVYNIAKEGKSILSFRGTASDAVKMSITHDTWGPACLSSAGHYHSRFSPVLQLKSDTMAGNPAVPVPSNELNGYASWGCVEIADHVAQDLALSYRRISDVNAIFPSLGTSLTISAVGEVLCMLVNGQKVYL